MSKFLFIDIDGTLLSESNTIDNSLMGSIASLTKSVRIVFATGRPRIGTLHLFNEISNNFDVISLNGAGYMVNLGEKTIVKSFDISNKSFFLDLWQNLNYTIVGFSDDSYYANQLNEHVEKEGEILNINPRVITSDLLLKSCIQKFTVIGKNADLKVIQDKFLKINFNCEFSKSGYLEMTEYNINKGTGVVNYFELIQNSISDSLTISIGDSENDQKMFHKCNYSFSVCKNSKIESDFITNQSNINGTKRVLNLISDLLKN